MDDVRGLDGKTLALRLEACRRELFEIRMKAALVKTPKPHRIRELKRDIARMTMVRRGRAHGS